MKTATLTAPAAWAPAIINGDYSGIDDTEAHQIHAWLAAEEIPADALATCEPAGFQWRHDAFQHCPVGADCEAFTFAWRPHG